MPNERIAKMGHPVYFALIQRQFRFDNSPEKPKKAVKNKQDEPAQITIQPRQTEQMHYMEHNTIIHVLLCRIEIYKL